MLNLSSVHPAITSSHMQDVLLIAFCYLSVQDLLSVSQTCNAFRQICAAKQIWLNVWRRDVLRKGLPQPCQLAPLGSLNGSQMKAAAMYALRLHSTLTCAPERRHIRKAPLYQAYPINWTRIVDGSWLLVAMADSSASILSLFSIESLLGARSEDLLAQVFLEGTVVNGFAEASVEYGIIIALELRTPSLTVEILSVQAHEDSFEFTRLARHHGISHIRALHGTYLGYALHDDVCVPSIMDWTTGTVAHLSTKPDVTGGVVAMALSNTHVALLTPKKLSIRQISRSEDSIVHFPVTAAFTVDQTVEYADLAFCEEASETTLRICISHTGGVYAYAIPTAFRILDRRSLDTALLWSHGIEPDDSALFARTLMRPMLDCTHATISWLEDAPSLSAGAPPVQFVSVMRGYTNLHTPSLNLSRFELSEQDMPALYAWSTRDYDEGLGLLSVGNIMGELCLFSFAPDTFCGLKDAIQTVGNLPWTGQTPLPQTMCTPYPPHPFCWQPGYPNEAEKQQLVQLWEKHWPKTLNEPTGWSRPSLYEKSTIYNFCDAIGNAAWVLEAQCHFLGLPIPLIRAKNYPVTLLKVGGLIVVYRADLDSDVRLCHVMDPGLNLDTIIAMLPESLDGDYMLRIVEGVVHTAVIEPGMAEEVRRVRTYRIWEMRHGINRWKDFKERGGQVSSHWLAVDLSCPIGLYEWRCNDECPVCYESHR